jgi:hypothetical protein
VVDVADDAPYGVHVLALGVLELPVDDPLAGYRRARLAASHGDDDVGGRDAVVGEQRRAVVVDGDAPLGPAPARRVGLTPSPGSLRRC